MQIKLWKSFSKRKNSTKRPNDSDAIILDVVLKEATSIEAPHFILKSQDFEYNYCQAFGHYYFISNITSVSNEHIMLECTQDLLATYKSDILNLNAFVLYSASNYDVMLPDNRVVIKPDRTGNSSNEIYDVFSDQGVFAVTVVNNIGGGASGATMTYLVQANYMRYLASFFSTRLSDDALTWFKNRLKSPFDSIVDSVWLPIKFEDINNIAHPVMSFILGNVQITDEEGTLLGAHTVQSTTNAVLHKGIYIPVTRLYTDFRNNDSTQTYELYIPFYGIVKLSSVDIKHNEIAVEHNIDLVNGDDTCIVRDGRSSETDDNILAVLNFNIGVSCPIAQIVNQGTGALASLGGVASGAIGLAAAATTTGKLTAALTTIASGMNAATSAAKETINVKGGLGGRSYIKNINHILTRWTNDTTDPDDLTLTQGRPLMQTVTLSTLTGYVQTADASINIAGLGNDKDIINGMLDSGIYIE